MGAHIGPGPLTRSAARELTDFVARTRRNADAIARRQRKPERWIPVTITDVDVAANTYSGREDAFAADGTRYAKPSGRQFGPGHFARIFGVGAGNDALSTVPAEAWVRHAITTGTVDVWELDTACKCEQGAVGGSGGTISTTCCPFTLIPATLLATLVVTSGACTCYDGASAFLYYSPGPGGDAWSGFFPTLLCGETNPGFQLSAVVMCSFTLGGQFSANLGNGAPNGVCPISAPPNISITTVCQPFSIRMGPWQATCCPGATFDLVITT